MKWITVRTDADLPPIDDWNDFPKEYIIKGYDDNSRGEPIVISCTAEDMKEETKDFDWFKWLDESEDSKVKALQDKLNNIQALTSAAAKAASPRDLISIIVKIETIISLT